MDLACGTRCRGIPDPPASSCGRKIDSNLSQGLKRSSSVACSPCTKFVREKQTKQRNKSTKKLPIGFEKWPHGVGKG